MQKPDVMFVKSHIFSRGVHWLKVTQTQMNVKMNSKAIVAWHSNRNRSNTAADIDQFSEYCRFFPVNSATSKDHTESEIQVDNRGFYGPDYHVVCGLDGQSDFELVHRHIHGDCRRRKPHMIRLEDQDFHHVPDGEGEGDEYGVVVHSWIAYQDESNNGPHQYSNS